jgi:hypothetical protein
MQSKEDFLSALFFPLAMVIGESSASCSGHSIPNVPLLKVLMSLHEIKYLIIDC